MITSCIVGNKAKIEDGTNLKDQIVGNEQRISEENLEESGAQSEENKVKHD